MNALAGMIFRPVNLLLKTGLFLLLNLTFSAFSMPGGEEIKSSGETTSDTTQAIVLYGHSFLFDPSRFSSEIELIAYLDSLLEQKNVNYQLLEEINLFMEIRKKDDYAIYSMIDSLFDLEEIPYALINQINFYVATRDFGRKDYQSLSVTSYFSGYSNKGHCFYEAWDIINPHPAYNPLTEPDTAVQLVLADSSSYCGYYHPVPGLVTSNFGWRNGRAHNGIDLDLRTGDPVRSAFDGVVRIAGRRGGYGNLVVVRHYNGLETYYAHLHRIKVKPGQSVEAGQLLGSGGNTGNSRGSHLHFEVRFRGKPLNPKHVISFNSRSLHSDQIIVNKTKWSYTAYPEGTVVHSVRKGESLSSIANRYGTTINRLCEINHIHRNSILRVGQKIRIS